MLLVVVNNGVLVEVRCVFTTELSDSKLLREKEDYVVLDLSHYHACKPTGWLNGALQQVTGNSKKETKLYDR